MITALDRRLNELVDVDAAPEVIATGFVFTEGPVWDIDKRCLYFSDIRQNRTYSWSESTDVVVEREQTAGANGNTLDLEGCILSCEKETRRVSRVRPDHSVETVAGNYMGMRLNSPNDLICLANGDI